MVSREQTRRVHIGSVAVGGGAAVSVQTMTKTDTRDVGATVAQIEEVTAAGCDIVRLAVADTVAAEAMREIRARTKAALVEDIHFDHRLALLCLDAGIDGLRINPGNIGGSAKVREVVAAARDRKVPIRIGVNAGSLEKDLQQKHGGNTAQALVESALGHVRILEDLDHREIKLSVKASDVPRTLAAYRLLAAQTGYPLHLGVTEAGTFLAGTVRSCVAMGILLAEGIGDTIRVSLTDTPLREVRVGLELLRALELRAPGPSVISCPTCGRVEVDIVSLAWEVETALDKLYTEQPDHARPKVALMGCMVNGPGEAREADIAIAGGKGRFALYIAGQHIRSMSEDEAVSALLDAVRNWQPA